MMEIKPVIKQILITLLMIFISYILQTSIFTHLELASVVPNFLIIITTSFGLMRGSKYGMGVGFVSGMILDCFSGSYFGIYLLIYLYLGFLSGLFKRMFYGDDIKLPLALIGANDIIYGILIYVIMFLPRKRFAFGYYLLNVIIPEAVYTILLSIVVYYIVLRINQWFDKDNKRSGQGFV